ncbi:MAG: transcription repressor NadR [Oscillospiraceae bacterium]
MTAAQRRDAILSALQSERQPLSASTLAQRFSVTRQVIVGDIALLRASGSRISATPRGYVLERSQSGFTRQLACRHSATDTEAELNAMVDCGCTVVDVTVEHAVYGQLTAPLQLSSRYDVAQYISRMSGTKALPLSALTEGVHLHTVRCPDEERFQRLRAALSSLGFLWESSGD